jgi:hypothetical protein
MEEISGDENQKYANLVNLIILQGEMSKSMLFQREQYKYQAKTEKWFSSSKKAITLGGDHVLLDASNCTSNIKD